MLKLVSWLIASSVLPVVSSSSADLSLETFEVKFRQELFDSGIDPLLIPILVPDPGSGQSRKVTPEDFSRITLEVLTKAKSLHDDLGKITISTWTFSSSPSTVRTQLLNKIASIFDPSVIVETKALGTALNQLADEKLTNYHISVSKLLDTISASPELQAWLRSFELKTVPDPSFFDLTLKPRIVAVATRLAHLGAFMAQNSRLGTLRGIISAGTCATSEPNPELIFDEAQKQDAALWHEYRGFRNYRKYLSFMRVTYLEFLSIFAKCWFPDSFQNRLAQTSKLTAALREEQPAETLLREKLAMAEYLIVRTEDLQQKIETSFQNTRSLWQRVSPFAPSSSAWIAQLEKKKNDRTQIEEDVLLWSGPLKEFHLVERLDHVKGIVERAKQLLKVNDLPPALSALYEIQRMQGSSPALLNEAAAFIEAELAEMKNLDAVLMLDVHPAEQAIEIARALGFGGPLQTVQNLRDEIDALKLVPRVVDEQKQILKRLELEYGLHECPDQRVKDELITLLNVPDIPFRTASDEVHFLIDHYLWADRHRTEIQTIVEILYWTKRRTLDLAAAVPAASTPGGAVLAGVAELENLVTGQLAAVEDALLAPEDRPVDLNVVSTALKEGKRRLSAIPNAEDRRVRRLVTAAKDIFDRLVIAYLDRIRREIPALTIPNLSVQNLVETLRRQVTEERDLLGTERADTKNRYSDIAILDEVLVGGVSALATDEEKKRAIVGYAQLIAGSLTAAEVARFADAVAVQKFTLAPNSIVEADIPHDAIAKTAALVTMLKQLKTEIGSLGSTNSKDFLQSIVESAVTGVKAKGSKAAFPTGPEARILHWLIWISARVEKLDRAAFMSEAETAGIYAPPAAPVPRPAASTSRFTSLKSVASVLRFLPGGGSSSTGSS